MSDLLEQLVATPDLIEVDSVEVNASPAEAWQAVRHGDLTQSPLVRALFRLRQLPERLRGEPPLEARLSLDDLNSSEHCPGFAILLETPGAEIAVGAIGKVWRPEIEFRYSQDANAFNQFAEPGWVKVAWSLRVQAWGPSGSKVTLELWVSATDEASWRRFKHYYSLIGIGSHFIRRSVLAGWGRQLGDPREHQNEVQLAGDSLLADAQAQLTHSIDIQASAERIWPWLIQIGAGRAGFYSYDLLDNDGHPSARQVHPNLQHLSKGQIIAATHEGSEGFEVLAIDPPHALLLGGLYDTQGEGQLAFAAPRPRAYWHVTWSFVLHALDGENTRLFARARAAFSPDQRWHAMAIRPVHQLMQTEMLQNLARRAEGRLARDTLRDVVEGIGGALWIAFGMATPFLRPQRRRWGVDALTAARVHPGDDLVAEPRWAWTHGITIDAPAATVWPWVAQVGVNRGGFYSYQWLENLVGCQVDNAEAVHPEWELKLGDPLVLHPRAPALRVTRLDAGHYFVASAEVQQTPDSGASADSASAGSGPWVRFSWLFWVEPLTDARCRVISRARYACSEDLATRLMNGPLLLEPVGFAMDRRMLKGIKQLSEQTHAA